MQCRLSSVAAAQPPVTLPRCIPLLVVFPLGNACTQALRHRACGLLANHPTLVSWHDLPLSCRASLSLQDLPSWFWKWYTFHLIRSENGPTKTSQQNLECCRRSFWPDRTHRVTSPRVKQRTCTYLHVDGENAVWPGWIFVHCVGGDDPVGLSLKRKGNVCSTWKLKLRYQNHFPTVTPSLSAGPSGQRLLKTNKTETNWSLVLYSHHQIFRAKCTNWCVLNVVHSKNQED